MIIVDVLFKSINDNLVTIFVSIIIIIICFFKLKEKDKIIDERDKIIDERDDKFYKISVQYIFDKGYPVMEYQQMLVKSTQPSSQYADSEYITTELELQIVSNIETYRIAALQYSSTMSSKIDKYGMIYYATESDVQGFVKDVMFDVLNASGIRSRTKIFNEITLTLFRPDIWIVTIDKYLPLCVIEVKKPFTNGNSLFSDRNIVSQVCIFVPSLLIAYYIYIYPLHDNLNKTVDNIKLFI